MNYLPEEMQGAVDLHVHSAPDVVERRYNDLELAQESKRAGMSAILIKSHQNSTVERAWLVSRVVPGIEVRGGLVLNETVGGFNLAAVQLALQLGAKEIWMPTMSARNHMLHTGKIRSCEEGGLTAMDPAGGLKPEVESILMAVSKSDCILGTGHLSPEEGFAVIGRALQLGVKKILVTHPEWAPTFYPNQMQRELAARGVMFERCFVSTTHRCGHTPFETIESAIADAGVPSTILASDLGQPDTPPPVEGFRVFSERLRAAGFSPEQIRAMAVENPRRLMLDPVRS